MISMRAIITVGLGFGDEGKGATVDFLTRHHRAEMVVRYCGGAQAGHNIELPDGRRHTFSQFGAGTLAGASTYLGSRVIINPATLVPEAQHLEQLGIMNPRSNLTVHPSCLVSTIYHITMNRLRETARGDERHGSCGLGIGESRHYWLRFGQDAIVARDLLDHRRLIDKLTLLRDRLLLEMQSLDHVDRTLAECLYETSPSLEADLLMESMQEVSYSADLPAAETAIFEGSQGVLLDESFGFHPYTTWSTVTTRHAIEILSAAGVESYQTLGLTRAYSTRHGVGPFPTRCKRMTADLNDPGNPRNDWQGVIQAGPLDLVLLRYACEVNSVDGLVVNNVDELPASPQLCRRYLGFDRLAIPLTILDQQRLTQHLFGAQPEMMRTTRSDLLGELSGIAPIEILADGPFYPDRTFVKL